MTKLTPQQEALIIKSWEKWKALVLSTEPIDHQKAIEAVKAAYDLIGREKPEILFFDSPYSAIRSEIWSQLKRQEDKTNIVLKLEYKLIEQPKKPVICNLVREELLDPVGLEIKPLNVNELPDDVALSVYKLLAKQLDSQGLVLDVSIQCYTYSWCCLFDFCTCALNYTLDQKAWETLQLIAKHCGYLFTFEKVVVVCNRPIKLLLDSENRPHAEGEPAILFADGFSVYAHHGVWLPEK